MENIWGKYNYKYNLKGISVGVATAANRRSLKSTLQCHTKNCIIFSRYTNNCIIRYSSIVIPLNVMHIHMPIEQNSMKTRQERKSLEQQTALNSLEVDQFRQVVGHKNEVKICNKKKQQLLIG